MWVIRVEDTLDKQCTDCGEINSQESNFCSNCGGSGFGVVPPALPERWSTVSPIDVNGAVRLGSGRVAVLTVLSMGLYLFWWFYLTWKQLTNETHDEHFPVWHSLALFVPFYGLFRMHRHISVINNLANGIGLTIFLHAGIAVVLLLVSSLLITSTPADGNSMTESNVGVDVLIAVISVTLTTTLVVLAQGTLNRYWQSVKGPTLRDARLGVGEVIVVLIGILVWLETLGGN
jgi:hypothetical protein